MRLKKTKDISFTTYIEHCTGGPNKCTKERKTYMLEKRSKTLFINKQYDNVYRKFLEIYNSYKNDFSKVI